MLCIIKIKKQWKRVTVILDPKEKENLVRQIKVKENPLAKVNSEGLIKTNRILLTTVNPQVPTEGVEDLDLIEVQRDQETTEVEENQDQAMVLLEMKDQEMTRDLIEAMVAQETKDQ